MSVLCSVPAVPAVSKIVSTAPDLQPKPASAEMETEVGVAEQEVAEEEEEEDSDSDEDDVEITIGDISTAPGGANYNRSQSYTRIGASSAGGRCIILRVRG